MARRVTRLGAIELSAVTLPRPDPTLVAGAVREGLRREGLALLPWSDAATALRRRLAFLHRALGDPWPDVSDDALLAQRSRPGWAPSSPGSAAPGTCGASTCSARCAGCCRGRRPAGSTSWRRSGSRCRAGRAVRVDYAGDQPVLAVRIQEVFGWRAAPALADGRVPLLLHLLSPARRPAAVTADLASFWATGYPQVRAELRGRYPKHAWPEDPAGEPPRRGVRRPG